MPMMKGVAIAIVAIVACVASTASAQGKPEPFVYLIRAAGCTTSPVVRSQTGFRASQPDKRGIITALHGVVGCAQISARNDQNDVINGLMISTVDVEADVALLSSPVLEMAAVVGIPVAPQPNWQSLIEVWVFGHPFGTANHGDSLKLRIPPIRNLSDEAPPDVVSALQARSSPTTRLSVVSLQGPLFPGHSGAPIVNRNGDVVAVANGGLQRGTVGLGWAVPYQSIRLTPVAINPRVTELAKYNSADLFKFDATSTAEGRAVGTIATLEAGLRYILDDVGSVLWGKRFSVDSTTEETRSFIKLAGCELQLLVRAEINSEPGKNARGGEIRGFVDSSRTTYALDLTKLSVAPTAVLDTQNVIFPRGLAYITVRSQPGFQVIRLDRRSIREWTDSRGAIVDTRPEQHNTFQTEELRLYYMTENAANAAIETLETTKRSCATAQ